MLNGRVVEHFGTRQDSRTEIVGVEVEGDRFIVKIAHDGESIGWLENAVAFHAAVRHPVIPTVVDSFTTESGGFAVVEEWASGDVLVDGFNPAVLPRDDPASTYARFLALPAGEIAAAVGDMIDAHVAVAVAGFVAVDLYDGCVVYDFDRRRVSLIDLDMYRPGPFALDVDRQYGSSAFMAPEEWQRGATIDERTTVYTLGRMGLVLLGCPRYEPPTREAFRGPAALFDVALHATRPDPAERFGTVRELRAAWEDARHVA